MRHSQLWTAVVAAVVGAVVVAFSAYVLLHQLLPSGDEPIQPKDLMQFALTIVAGIGGVVALVVAYRRQQGIEESRFVERFGAAASQLGHSDVAVRLAGVYAMAGVADEASVLGRQQCVDVLCGYLRLPYSPALGASHQSELQHKVPGREGEENTHRFQYRQNDKEVRQTIVRVITAHLQRDAPESWAECNLDFQGAVLEDADFEGATFSGNRTSFDEVTFSGNRTSFDEVTFSGMWTSFVGATFSGNDTLFRKATFSGNRTSFEGATFSGKQTAFDGATFSAVGTSFEGATFSGMWTSFMGATFSGNDTSFQRATFSGNDTFFRGATFSGRWTSFEGATFSGKRTWFQVVTFNAELRTSFEEATFSGNDTSFMGATFSGNDTSFEGATFSGKQTSFEGATFSGKQTSFEGATFSGDQTSFDWDDDLPAAERRSKPHNVLPSHWPPKGSD